MQRHADPDGAKLAPVLGQQRALAGHGGPERILGGPKRRLRAVPNLFEEHSVVSGNQALQDGQLSIDRLPHGSSILLPERGTACDVGEEKGDGATG
jgi:hypothetical protein